MKYNFLKHHFTNLSSDVEEDIDFLGTVPIFDSLSKRQKIKLHAIIHVRNYEKGECVFRQGDPGVGLYIVKKGLVEVFHETEELSCCKISVLKKGDFFGEIALLNESVRTATVVAYEKTTLLGLFKPDLLNLMDADPRLGLGLVYCLAQVVADRLRLINTDLCGFDHGT